MKNYMVRVTRPFNDTVEKTEDGKDRPRKVNDIFDCTKERYEFLKSHNVVVLMGIKQTPVEKVEDEYKNAVKKTTKKKKKEVKTDGEI